jgi:hypothetical protein
VTSSRLESRPSVEHRPLRLINPGRPAFRIHNRRNRLPRNRLPRSRLPRNRLPRQRPRPAPWPVRHTAPPLALDQPERDRRSEPPRRVRVDLVPSRALPGRSGPCRARWRGRSDGLRSERATVSTATSAGPAAG